MIVTYIFNKLYRCKKCQRIVNGGSFVFNYNELIDVDRDVDRIVDLINLNYGNGIVPSKIHCCYKGAESPEIKFKVFGDCEFVELEYYDMKIRGN